MDLKVILWIIILALLAFHASSGIANEKEWNTVGLRAGLNDERNDEFFRNMRCMRLSVYLGNGAPRTVGFSARLLGSMQVWSFVRIMRLLDPWVLVFIFLHRPNALPYQRGFIQRISGDRNSEQRILGNRFNLPRLLASIFIFTITGPWDIDSNICQTQEFSMKIQV